MSKSSKKKPFSNTAKPTPQPVAAKEVSKPKPAVAEPVEATLPQETGFELIRFDKRVKWFLGICIGLFFLLTLAKIHTVSIPAWNQLMPDGSDLKRGLVSGEPRRIRMDDYAVGTPWILSQANKGFPTQNETIGGQKAPILVAPTKHFSEVFKPDHWGFFILDVERGYAWMYNFRILFALVGATFMLLLLTGNNFWLSEYL